MLLAVMMMTALVSKQVRVFLWLIKTDSHGAPWSANSRIRMILVVAERTGLMFCRLPLSAISQLLVERILIDRAQQRVLTVTADCQ